MSAKDNLTAVLYGINDLRLEQRPIPVPKDNEVLLKMGVVGICGSDVHYLVKGRIGHFVLEKPMIIGHEAAGTVVQLGKDVKNLAIGDRVAIEPGVPCRTCEFCKSGRYNLCEGVIFCATPPHDGNLGRYYTHAADFCFRLPDNVSLEEGSLLEPLSVAVHGCNRGNVKVGSVVAIFGAGPIGLVSLLTANAYGASKILVVDILAQRLDIAKKLGANCTILTDANESVDDLSAKIVKELGCRPDISLECSGAEKSVNAAINSTKNGGTAVLIGMGAPQMTVSLCSALIREVDIKGVFRYANCYPIALDLIASGRVDVRPLITHHFALEKSLDAFKTCMNPAMNAIKILIHADSDWKQ